MKSILNNLLKNAYTYIEEQNRGKIFITTDETDAFYLLKIKDTAKGVSPLILDRIFDRYFTTNDAGTGLGLSFCKTIMLSFGGNIEAKSIENKFIEFTLTFPKGCYVGYTN